ncbi:MAG: hypothetical protein AAF481_18925 [Acidobacteriota bacterium]
MAAGQWKPGEKARAAEVLTLAGIASVRPGEPRDFVREGVDEQLGRKAYATGGVWQRVWGPGLSRENPPPDNAAGIMAYAARRRPEDDEGTDAEGGLAVALRSPRWSLLAHLTDREWIETVPYPHGPAGARVSRGALQGLHQLLAMRDPRRGALMEFVERQSDVPWVATGHGLSGAVAILLHLEWARHEGDPEREITSWAFGAPSIGNQVFEDWVEETIGAASYRVVNPYDTVPYVWARLDDLVRKGIPNDLAAGAGDAAPLDMRAVLGEAEDRLRALPPSERFASPRRVGERILRGVQIPLPGQSSEGQPWLAQVDEQHAPNGYLWLLEAPELVDEDREGPFGERSLLPHFAATLPIRVQRQER